MIRWMLEKLGYVPAAPAGAVVEGRRRWDAGRTDRTNEAHWRLANDRPINQDLDGYLRVLRERAKYEAANNASVAGVIRTYSTSVVGRRGPSLQIQTPVESYNDAAEDLWADWFARPDINGVLSGCDLLSLWVDALWTDGEFLTQIVSEPSPGKGPRTRLHAIGARRLDTPYGQVANNRNITLGIKRTDTGKPIAYWVNKTSEALLYELTHEFVEIPAEHIIHGYDILEPGQMRGVPMLAPALQDIADLRDFDIQVLDAMRAAADYAILLSNKTPDARHIDVDDGTTANIERRMMMTLPPGWEASQMKPEQPHTQYLDFRRERLRAVGRAVNMPLMMILLDSSNHNYSSARFDGQLYQRGVTSRQEWLERTALNRVLDRVLEEAELLRLIPPRPARMRPVWTWDSQPHVDPKKEAEAEQQLLSNATMTFAEACASRGLDPVRAIAERKRWSDAFEAADLTAPEWLSAGQVPEEPAPPVESDEDRAAARLRLTLRSLRKATTDANQPHQRHTPV